MHDLKSELIFSGMKTYFKWYDSEATQKLLKIMEAKFKNVSIDIDYKKIPKL